MYFHYNHLWFTTMNYFKNYSKSLLIYLTTSLGCSGDHYLIKESPAL